MRIAKRMLALALSLLLLMMNAAQAEVPFLVHSNGWNLDDTPVDVLLKADVDAHMPFDDDRLAMLTPITDLLALRLVTGKDEGKVTISLEEEELLALQYRGNAVQLSCLPETTYTAEKEPMSMLLGSDVSYAGSYETLGLAPEGETLLTDGRILMKKVITAFAQQGKKTKKAMSIAGFGKAAYRIDYVFTAAQTEAFKAGLLENCPQGWLREIIDNLTFSGKQSIRMYFTENDVMLRMEYNGSCGRGDDLRKVNLVFKQLHNDLEDKDYIELKSPALKGRNKNSLVFERTMETTKDGVRALKGSFKYTVTANSVTSIWDGEFDLNNAFTETSDVLGGEFTVRTKLNDGKYEAITIAPALTISGSQEMPVITGSVTVTEKYAGRVTEQAKVSVDLKVADPLVFQEREVSFDLSAMDENDLAAVRAGVTQAAAAAIVRPIIVRMGTGAEYFFRELPADAVQSIIEAASSAAQDPEEGE